MVTDTAARAECAPAREQVVYANLLIVGVWLGIFVLLVTFGLYVFGVLSPHVSVEEIPKRWGTGVGEYLEHTHWPTGWSWTAMLEKGDVLNYVGFVFLAMLTVLGYLVLLGAYVRERRRLFATICVLEIITLLLAASGLLTAGGH